MIGGNKNLDFESLLDLFIRASGFLTCRRQSVQAAAEFVDGYGYSIPALPVAGASLESQRMRLAKPDRRVRLRHRWRGANGIFNVVVATLEGERMGLAGLP